MGISGQFVTSQARPVFLGQSLFMTGFNPNVDSATVPHDVWPIGGLAGAANIVTFASVAALVSVVSTDANDTAAGTGAQLLFLTGVNDSFEEISEVVATDGLTPVLTSQSFLHVQTASVIASGATGVNEGIITFTIGGGVVNGIAIGKSQTQSTARIIPVSIVPRSIAHLIDVFAVSGRQQSTVATITLVITPTAGGVLEALDIPITANGGNFELNIEVPATFGAGTKVVARVTEVSANNTLVSAGFQFIWKRPLGSRTATG